MSRRSGGRSHYGGSRAAAEAGADVAVLTIEPGPAFVARLYEAFQAAPTAKRFLIHTNHAPPRPGADRMGPHPPPRPGADRMGPHPPPLAGEGRVGADDYPISVVAVSLRDTVKEVANGMVTRTIPRENLVQLRGPWRFTKEALADALARVEGHPARIANLVQLCQAADLNVRVLTER